MNIPLFFFGILQNYVSCSLCFYKNKINYEIFFNGEKLWRLTYTGKLYYQFKYYYFQYYFKPENNQIKMIQHKIVSRETLISSQPFLRFTLFMTDSFHCLSYSVPCIPLPKFISLIFLVWLHFSTVNFSLFIIYGSLSLSSFLHSLFFYHFYFPVPFLFFLLSLFFFLSFLVPCPFLIFFYFLSFYHFWFPVPFLFFTFSLLFISGSLSLFSFLFTHFLYFLVLSFFYFLLSNFFSYYVFFIVTF